MKLSIIIPAYNEEKTVAKIVKQVNSVDFGSLQREIIVVDDGSSDRTLYEIRKIEKDISRLYVFRHKKNKGKGSAVVTGIKHSTGDIIIIQDADLEYSPSDIPRLVKPIIDGKTQVVYGSRLKSRPILFGKNKTPFLTHFLGNKFLSLITSFLYGYPVSDMETGHKIFTRDAISGIRLKARSFDLEPEITAKILKKGIKIMDIPITVHPRSYKEGKKLYWHKDGLVALWTLIKYKFTD